MRFDAGIAAALVDGLDQMESLGSMDIADGVDFGTGPLAGPDATTPTNFLLHLEPGPSQ